MIRISPTYYTIDATFENPILFQRDTSWGSGIVTFDGIGFRLGDSTGYGLIHITIGGVSIDGVSGVSNSYDGILIQNSPRIGICYYSDSQKEGGIVQYVKFYGNGTLYPTPGSGGAGSGQLYFKYKLHIICP